MAYETCWDIDYDAPTGAYPISLETGTVRDILCNMDAEYVRQRVQRAIEDQLFRPLCIACSRCALTGVFLRVFFLSFFLSFPNRLLTGPGASPSVASICVTMLMAESRSTSTLAAPTSPRLESRT